MRVGYIASLNEDRTAVTRVFPSCKAVQEYVGYADLANVSRMIKTQRLIGGHYYVSWTDVSAGAQQEYLEQHTLPDIERQLSLIHI